MATLTARLGLQSATAERNGRRSGGRLLPLHIIMMKPEAAKWEKITYAGIATCAVLGIYDLSKGHHKYPDPPPYPYLHIRNKDFPWGPDGLFERKKKHADH